MRTVDVSDNRRTLIDEPSEHRKDCRLQD
eukprot:COSAG06_NODE_38086_length_427_cov_1.524390_1_plen_28_part_10